MRLSLLALACSIALTAPVSQGLAQVAMDASGMGLVIAGYDSRTCNGTIEGAIRYNSASACTSFEPDVPSCTANNGGPFSQIDSVATGNGFASRIHYDGTYIYACEWHQLIAYSFDGSTLTQEGSTAHPSNCEDVWSDGTHVFVTDSGTGNFGVHAYTFDGASFSNVGNFVGADDFEAIWGDGTYIYASDRGIWGIRALTFDGSSFTSVATYSPGGLPIIKGIWGDGTYIYFGENSELYALTFDGSSFTLVDSDFGPSSFSEIWGDGTYIYVADGSNGLQAYSFDGSAFTLEDSVSNAEGFYGVWSDGTNIFSSNSANGLKAYSFDGTTLTEVDTIDTPDGPPGASGVIGDGTNIFLGNGATLHAFSGFECNECDGGPVNAIQVCTDSSGSYDWTTWGE